MPRNGTGTFAAANSSVNPAVASTVIEAAPFNTLIDDVETGITESIARDGQTTTSAVIPFASGVQTDTVVERTPAAGVTLDSVLLKDGRVDTSKGADIASATSTDIWAATGNFVHITGTVAITGFGTASKAGLWRLVEFDGILTLTHGANLDCPGSANITTAAGDRALIVANTTTAARVLIFQRKDGLALTPTPLNLTGLTAETALATDDELLIYDTSELANNKITVANLFKVINVLAAETAPAIDDVLALYDTSASTADRISLANLLKVVDGLTEDTTPDTAADFVLTYDTSAAAPKKVKPANLVASGIGGVTMQVFTTPGANTWTKPAGVKYLRVCCVGGGGGGAGVSSAAGGTAGGGGGAGYSEKIVDVSALATGATIAVAVGAAGAGGAITPTNGTAGGDTTFNTTVCVGKGGSGGLTNGSPGAGGVAGTGDYSVVGEAGDNGSGPAAIAVYYKTGAGGNAALGFGHGARIPDTENGAAGTGYGGGGSGASDGDGSGQSGGAGTAGICIVYEFK